MDPIDRQAIGALDQLINTKRNFQTAFQFGSDYVTTETASRPISADVWFRVALTARLSGNDPRPFIEGARSAPDYTPILEGDLLRDEMLQAIREHNFAHAWKLVPEIWELHSTDKNRVAVWHMAKGRLLFAQDEVAQALTHYEYACVLWAELGDAADQQWITNTKFHQLRATVWLRSSDRHQVYREFMARETARGRKFRARTMYRLGKPGVMADMVLELAAS
jgi:hypothetical protein